MDETAPATPERRPLRRGVSVFLSGNVVYIGTQFLMLVGLARLTDTATVGLYALALALTAPIFTFASLKLREVHISDATGLNRTTEYYALRALTSVLALAASVALATALAPSSTDVVMAVSAFKAVEAQLDVVFGTLQRAERLRAVAYLQGLRGVLGLALFIAALALGAPLWAAVLVMTLATGVALLTSLVVVRRMGHPIRWSASWTRLASLARKSVPLGVSVALASLAAAVPRFALEGYRDTGQVGVFAALAYFLLVPATVVTAISEVAMPRLADLAARGEGHGFMSQLRTLVLAGAAVGAASTIGALLLGRFVLDVLFGPAYAEAWPVMVVLFIGATLQYATLYIGTSAQALQLFSVQAPISLVSLVALVVASVALVPPFGLMGAAVAIGLSQVVQALLYVRLLNAGIRPRLLSHTGG